MYTVVVCENDIDKNEIILKWNEMVFPEHRRLVHRIRQQRSCQFMSSGYLFLSQRLSLSVPLAWDDTLPSAVWFFCFDLLLPRTEKINCCWFFSYPLWKVGFLLSANEWKDRTDKCESCDSSLYRYDTKLKVFLKVLPFGWKMSAVVNTVSLEHNIHWISVNCVMQR